MLAPGLGDTWWGDRVCLSVGCNILLKGMGSVYLEGKELSGCGGEHLHFLRGSEMEICYIITGPRRHSSGDCDAHRSPVGAAVI